MIGGSPGRRRHRKPKTTEMGLINGGVDDPRKVVFRHLVIKATGKQNRQSAVITFDEAGHLITPSVAASGVYGASRFYTASVESGP